MKTLGNDTVEIGTEKNPSTSSSFKPESSLIKLARVVFGIPLPVLADEGAASPYLKLNKWEDEVSLKVSIPYATSDTPTVILGSETTPESKKEGSWTSQDDGTKLVY